MWAALTPPERQQKYRQITVLIKKYTLKRIYPSPSPVRWGQWHEGMRGGVRVRGNLSSFAVSWVVLLIVALGVCASKASAQISTESIQDDFCSNFVQFGSDSPVWEGVWGGDDWTAALSGGVQSRTDATGIFTGSANAATNAMISGAATLMDYTVSVDIRNADQDTVGLVARYASPGSFYACFAASRIVPACTSGGTSLDDLDVLRIMKVDWQGSCPGAEPNGPFVVQSIELPDQILGFTLSPTKRWRMTLTVDGNSIRCDLNDLATSDVPEYSITHVDPSPLPAGRFGMYAFDNGATVAEEAETFDTFRFITLDTDTDGDQLPDAVESLLGTSPTDPDSDNDSMPDGFEVGLNFSSPRNTDGTDSIDALDTDSDNDGATDFLEVKTFPYDAPDFGENGACTTAYQDDSIVPTPCLSDANCANPGRPVCERGVCVQCRDDADGTPDSGCAAAASDCEENTVDPTLSFCAVCTDENGNGPDSSCGTTPDTPFCLVGTSPSDPSACVECLSSNDCPGSEVCDVNNVCNQSIDGDVDGDGLDNLVDADDDGDGIADIVEGGGVDFSADTDGDGISDFADPDADKFRDNNEDGVDDRADFDGDGVPNHLDLDVDNDGIPDVVESGLGEEDADGDGRIDDRTDDDGDGVAQVADPDDTSASQVGEDVDPLDSDNDLTPDYRDADSDNDGVRDSNEGHDADSDGRPDVTPGDDSNLDGWADAYDGNQGGAGAAPPDRDGDGTPNYLDVDDDGDTINTPDEDVVNQNGDPTDDDTDNDGTPNYLDVDDDGDTINTVAELGPNQDDPNFDFDGDGIPDYLDDFSLTSASGINGGAGCSSHQPPITILWLLVFVVPCLVRRGYPGARP